MQLCAVGDEAVPERARMGQATTGQQGVAYEALDNGFLSCAEPRKLQAICDSLGPQRSAIAALKGPTEGGETNSDAESVRCQDPTATIAIDSNAVARHRS
jgi:hypothetical protein